MATMTITRDYPLAQILRRDARANTKRKVKLARSEARIARATAIRQSL